MIDLEAQDTQRALSIKTLQVPIGDLRLTLIGLLLLVLLVTAGESGGFQRWPRAVQVGVEVPRLLLGFAYVFFVPGYWLTSALFPTDERSEDGGQGLDGIERAGLSLGLSVAWVPVLALIIDRLPWGLRLWPIFLGEIASILVFVAVTLWRRAQLPAGETYTPPWAWRPRPWWRTLSTYEKRIYKLSLAALFIAGLAAAWIFVIPSPDEFMTEFYILGEEGLAENYPREAVQDETLSVTMGIRNLERSTESYLVEVWAIDVWEDRAMIVAREGPFKLARGEQLEIPVRWFMPWSGQDQQVEFRLFSYGEEFDFRYGEEFSNTQQTPWAHPYRRLRLWLDVRTPTP